MKRIIALLCAVVLVAVSMCACSDMTSMMDKTKSGATEAAAATENAAAYQENKRETIARETMQPTDAAPMTEDDTDGIFTEDGDLEETIEDRAEDMIEDGKVEDGDGNVGDAENHDGDMNIDENAAD